MKNTINLSFHSRLLKERKVLSEGEKASRAQQAEIIGDNLVGKWLPFQFNNDDLHCIEYLRAPMVIVSSLQHKVLQLLEDYNKYVYINNLFQSKLLFYL